MLKDATLSELAKRAGVSLSDLQKAIKSEVEEEITFEHEGEFISNTDLELIKERAGKQNYAEWAKIFTEKKVKELKAKEGIDIEGKTIEGLIDALKEKIQKDSGSEPNKKIQDLESDKAKLQQVINEKESEIEKLNNEKESIYTDFNVKSKLPDALENGLSREDLYTLYRAQRNVKGNEVIDLKTGEVIKDKKLNPITIEDDIKTFLSRFGEQKPIGRKDGDSIPQPKNNIESFTKLSEVNEYFEKNNIPQPQQVAILSKAMKNEGFKINE